MSNYTIDDIESLSFKDGVRQINTYNFISPYEIFTI